MSCFDVIPIDKSLLENPEYIIKGYINAKIKSSPKVKYENQIFNFSVFDNFQNPSNLDKALFDFFFKGKSNEFIIENIGKTTMGNININPLILAFINLLYSDNQLQELLNFQKVEEYELILDNNDLSVLKTRINIPSSQYKITDSFTIDKFPRVNIGCNNCINSFTPRLCDWKTKSKKVCVKVKECRKNIRKKNMCKNR
jgi:hypothetical protein